MQSNTPCSKDWMEISDSISEVEIVIEKACAVLEIVMSNYFEKTNPDPATLVFYYEHYTALLGVAFDYVVATKRNLEKAREVIA